MSLLGDVVALTTFMLNLIFRLKAFVNGLSASGQTYYSPAITKAFELFQNSDTTDFATRSECMCLIKHSSNIFWQ